MSEVEFEKMVKEIHEAIVGNIDGTPGLMERVRCLETFKNSIMTKFNAILGFIGTNIVVLVMIFLKIGQ